MRRHWFLIAYLVVLGLALAWPEPGAAGGVLHLEAFKSWCIAGLFLCTGLVLPGRRLANALGAWPTHLLLNGLGFIVAPLFGLALAQLAGALGQPTAVQHGLLILACLPTTIGSCVAITGLAGGNQGLAVINSMLGNLLGLIVTPLLILLFLGRTGTAPVGTVITQLSLLVVAPVLVGQAVRLRAAARLDALRTRIGVISGSLLLIILLGIFSNLARSGLVAGAAVVIGLCLTLLGAMLGTSWLAAGRLPRPDRIAVTITASHKTATLGIPLIHLLYAGDPHLPLLLLPIAVYHIVQLIVTSVLASRLSRPHPDRPPLALPP